MCALAIGIVIRGYSVKKIMRRLVGSYKWLFSETGRVCEEKRVNYWSLKQRQMKSGRLSSEAAGNQQAKLSSSVVHYG